MSPDVQNLYPTIQSHSVSTFIHTCKLVEIVHQLLTEVYNPLKHETQDRIMNSLTTQKRCLEQWSKNLPDFLRLTPERLPAHSPPNHIVTLKYAILPLAFAKLTPAPVAFTTPPISSPTDRWLLQTITPAIPRPAPKLSQTACPLHRRFVSSSRCSVARLATDTALCP